MSCKSVFRTAIRGRHFWASESALHSKIYGTGIEFLNLNLQIINLQGRFKDSDARCGLRGRYTHTVGRGDSWCRMRFKPKNSRSLSIMMGNAVETVFSVAGLVIPTVRYELLKSLDRVYYDSLSDTHAIQHMRDMTQSELWATVNSRTIGNVKVWCVQFLWILGHLQLLLIYDV